MGDPDRMAQGDGGAAAAAGTPLLECPEIGLPRLRRGKVRDLFAVGDDRLLMVASDRLSAFDVVFGQGIPGKGAVLTGISALWFAATRDVVPNHLLDTRLDGVALSADARAVLAGRSLLVRSASRIDVECVVRGYLAGSGWKEYRRQQTVCGVPLPAGLLENGRLPEPIFTPALKNDEGHDENVAESAVADRFGAELAGLLRDVSLRLYRTAGERLAASGILLADTKFEFGMVDGRLTLIDELLTPDSSRFWPVDRYAPGRAIDSLDKQPIRDYVEAIGWNLEPPAPQLPPEVVAQAAGRYQEALARVRAALT